MEVESLKEVEIAIKKLNNNQAPGLDEIAAKLVKYAPVQQWKVIKSVLNECFEEQEHVRKGALSPIQNPGKPRGVLKNFRPVILLQIIRNILSNIAIRQMKDRYEEYISPSQSTYRRSRSTADIVCSHRWVIAKIQKVDTKVNLTGIDMSSVFDTINREHLLIIIKSNFDEDVYRMIRFLFSNTTLEMRLRGAATSPFTSNRGSLQGEGISGILFNIYLEDKSKG